MQIEGDLRKGREMLIWWVELKFSSQTGEHQAVSITGKAKQEKIKGNFCLLRYFAKAWPMGLALDLDSCQENQQEKGTNICQDTGNIRLWKAVHRPRSTRWQCVNRGVGQRFQEVPIAGICADAKAEALSVWIIADKFSLLSNEDFLLTQRTH